MPIDWGNAYETAVNSGVHQLRVAGAARVIEEEGNDFSYGKPDERDFVRMVLRGAGLPSRDNGDEWLEAVADALYEDMGVSVRSAEDLARFVLSRVR